MISQFVSPISNNIFMDYDLRQKKESNDKLKTQQVKDNNGNNLETLLEHDNE